ncbi:hypothetical protein [Streptomyces sp. NPDC002490]
MPGNVRRITALAASARAQGAAVWGPDGALLTEADDRTPAVVTADVDA